MKKLIVSISLMTFVLFIFTANANIIKQDKSKANVTVTQKVAKTGEQKAAAGEKKDAAAKCCKDGKKDAKCCKDAAKKDGAAKCDHSKAECAKKCADAKK
ncbi:MAG: hypothetical protein NTZ33_02205 [Bacteroidetes bacterium]|nr:hypothetical protein [Bacteroidota bacterium]